MSDRRKGVALEARHGHKSSYLGLSRLIVLLGRTSKRTATDYPELADPLLRVITPGSTLPLLIILVHQVNTAPTITALSQLIMRQETTNPA